MGCPSKGSAYLGLQNGTVTAKTKQLKSVFGTKTELIAKLITRNLKIVNDHEKRLSFNDHEKRFSVNDHEKRLSVNDHEKRLSVNDHENVLALMIKKNV